MKQKTTIYLAAALFNARETYFNAYLVNQLEKKGYKTNFPQRDGFEFGNLAKSLDKKLPTKEISPAVQNVIYLLDMGIFLPKSDVVLANLDEPLNEGMIVEISYAKQMNKFVLGFRTDARIPFGNIKDPLKGMHFFPAYQCNIFLYHYMPCKEHKDSLMCINSLATKIDVVIQNTPINKKNNIHLNDTITQVIEKANFLFKDISDIHSEEGLEEIAKRYVEKKEYLEEISPKNLS